MSCHFLIFVLDWVKSLSQSRNYVTMRLAAGPDICFSRLKSLFKKRWDWQPCSGPALDYIPVPVPYFSYHSNNVLSTRSLFPCKFPSPSRLNHPAPEVLHQSYATVAVHYLPPGLGSAASVFYPGSNFLLLS